MWLAWCMGGSPMNSIHHLVQSWNETENIIMHVSSLHHFDNLTKINIFIYHKLKHNIFKMVHISKKRPVKYYWTNKWSKKLTHQSQTRLLGRPQPQLYPPVALNQYILVNRTHKHYIYIYMLQGPTNILKSHQSSTICKIWK